MVNEGHQSGTLFFCFQKKNVDWKCLSDPFVISNLISVEHYRMDKYIGPWAKK